MSLKLGTEETSSRGVTAFETLPAYLWWSKEAKCAAVREPPDPVARRDNEAEAVIALTKGSTRAFIAQS